MNELQQYRSQIDAIDQELIQLLQKRSLIVKKVGHLKAQLSQDGYQSFVRSGREATMIRELYFNTEGLFPKEAIVSIWRTIISASLSLEQNLEVGLWTSQLECKDYIETHKYFGHMLKIHSIETLPQLYDQLTSHRLQIGVVKVTDHLWWRDLIPYVPTLQVFACIPFLKQETEPTLLAITSALPEATGDDQSILVIISEHPFTETVLREVFHAQGLPILSIMIETEEGAKTYCYLEIRGYIYAAKERLSLIATQLSLPKENILILGSYALPLSCENKNA